MATEQEEFAAWKRDKEKSEVFGLLDEWAEKSGLKSFLDTLNADDDEGDDAADLKDAADKTAKGDKVKAPKPKPKEEPLPQPISLAAKLFGSGDTSKSDAA